MNRHPLTVHLISTLALATALGSAPLQAQDVPPPPAPDGPGSSISLLDSALENRDEVGLNAEQATRLEQFQSASLERTAAAREVVAAWRAERIAEREARADSAQLDSPRERRRANRQDFEMAPEVQDAMQTLRAEGEDARAELRATLTVDQMERLWELAREDFPRLDRSAMAFRGRPRQPDFGRPFGPRFDRFGPPRSLRGFRR